ncbi:Cytochrome P450 [Trichinella pseudospiralis]
MGDILKTKKGCKDGLSTNLDVTAVLRQTSHSKNCPILLNEDVSITDEEHMEEDSFNEMFPADPLAKVDEGYDLVAEEQAETTWEKLKMFA